MTVFSTLTPLALIAIVIVGVLCIFYAVLIHGKDPYHKILRKVGFNETQVQVGNVCFNYAQGPNHGPDLLLLHAQHMDWYSYSRVLPELSKSFHIYVLDYHGHGKTHAPVASMNANQMGEDIAQFIETVIQEPVFISGNSSGGILTAWLAANKPMYVKAIVLEDPALLSSEYPRVLNTIADRSFAICDQFIKDNEEDFLIYWIGKCRDFFKRYVGVDVGPMLQFMVRLYRHYHEGQPVEIIFLPTTVRLMMRGMDYYDPHFGQGFHVGSWNKDFDHKDALRRIKAPTLLLHANYEITEEGVLNGALDQDDVAMIQPCVPNIHTKRIDSNHVIHLDHPDTYIQNLKDFFLNQP